MIFEDKIKKIKFMDLFSVISIFMTIIIFTVLNRNFLGPINIKNILVDTAPLLIVATGVTFVLLIGSVDLSVGSIASCACVFSGMGYPIFGNKVFLLILLFGVLAGAINGILFVVLKIPTFVVTLCTMNIWACVALLVSNGRPTGIPIEMWGSLKWSKIHFGIIPILFILSLLFLALFYIIQSKTKLGKSIFAVGSNQNAARMMGINVSIVKMWPFVFSGIGAALGGFFYTIILKSSLPTVGSSLTLMAMASVALGGTPLTGGKGSVLRTLLGVLLVIIIQNGLNVIAVDAFWQQIVFGAIVIFAVYLNTDKSSRSIIVK
ncbi:MAG: ABC transporter permease [Pleomorphochaeta sp.]